MAGRGSSDSQADQTPEKTTGTRARRTRRKLCLVVITILLNVLLYSALLCIAASVYQIISDPRDTSIYTQVALDTTSVCRLHSYNTKQHGLRTPGFGHGRIHFGPYNRLTEAEIMGPHILYKADL